MADQEAITPAEETRTRRRPALKTRDDVASDEARAQATQVSDALPPAPSEVTLGDRVFPVGRLTFNQMVAAEQAGIDLNEVLAGLQALRPSALRAFTWLMLQRGEKPPTLEEVGELMPVRQDEVVALLSCLLAASGLHQSGGSGKGNATGSPTGA